MELNEIKAEFDDRIEEYITENMAECKAQDMYLDPRAGNCLYVNSEAIAVKNSRRASLEYYGGFEYVDPDSVDVLGSYTFYRAEDDRVNDCISEFITSELLFGDVAEKQQ